MSREKIAIICGGPSSEHEVSCVSGGGVRQGIDASKYDVTLIGITKLGQWVLLPNDYPLAIKDGQMPEIALNKNTVELTSGGFIINGDKVEIDIVFPVLHGEFGEDGQIQQLLEDAQLPYVGSGVAASAHAMDKSIAKALFVKAGMQIAEGFEVTLLDWQKKTSDLTYPVFVKPANGGSSRGTHKVKKAADLESAIKDALVFDELVMVEQAINGREIECAVLVRDGQIQASTVGEIVIDPKFEFYDFQAKYLDDATTIKIPAAIPDQDIATIRELAITAFKAVDCQGLARCDFFYTAAGEIIINEINTMPGFTGSSVYPKLWQASGVDYTLLITTLIESASTN